MSQDHTRLPPTRGEGQGLAADVAVRLARFLREMMVATWEGGVDGFDVEDLARKHKLVRQTTYDPAKHGSNEVGAEPGDTWFVIAPEVRALLRSAAGQSLTEASVYGSSPLINEAHPPGGNSHEG